MRFIVPIIWIFLCATALAADPWTLTTADFHSEMLLVHHLDEHGAAVTTIAPQNPHTVALDQLLSLDRVTPLHTQPARFILHLSSGDRLAGEPVALKNDSLVWRETLIQEITVPLRSAVSIRRAGLQEPPSSSAHTEDVVTLANGDTVHGILSDVTGDAVAIQPAAGGDATSVPLDSLSSVDFATAAATLSTAPVTAPAARDFRISLVDDTVLTVGSVHSDEWKLYVTLPDGTNHELPFSVIQSIEQINGPVLWLSSMKPSENIQKPFIGSERPARFDRSITGGPIRFGDRTYARGIGVHAYSRLSWQIDPNEKTFRTQYAIDGDAPYADVTVRILLDGKVVHERKDFHAGELSPVAKLDLAGGHTLTLEVDYGKNVDVQARLNWIEPAMIK